MIVPAAIRQRYIEWEPFLREVEKRVESTLVPFCRSHGFIFEGRIKKMDSASEKIESGRYCSWNDLDDLYACTIAVPLSADESIAHEFLRQTFEIDEVKQRGVIPKPPDAFRFDSTRVILRLRLPPGVEVGEEPSIYRLKFEVQIKSLFDFAWAKTTHALTYKSRLVDWKRYRLAAHLKATAEQADFLLVGFEQAAELVTDGRWPDTDDKTRLRKFFEELIVEERIPREAHPRDWSRFTENLYRAIQVLEGQRPSGQSTQPLQSLDPALRILQEYFTTVDIDTVPRSLSLFQISLGVLCSSGEFEGRRTDYFLLTTEDFRTIFPEARLPGIEFTIN